MLGRDGVRGRDSEDRRGGASLTCPEWETNILRGSLYFYCISAVFLLCLCLVFVYCVIFVLTCPDWESNILRGSLYFYCISVVFLLYLCICVSC